MATLQKNIQDRLRAGALVTLVEEGDEVLAVAACEMASKSLPNTPVQILSVLDDDFIEKFSAHKNSGHGVLIVADFLRVFGNNPNSVRMVREFALQTKAPPYPRLILVEAPGVTIPDSLKGDIEYIMPPLPTVEELKQELEVFIKDQKVVLEGNGENKHAIALGLAGLARHEAARLLARCWVDKKTLDPAWLSEAKAKRVLERSKGALSFINPEAADVGGQGELLKWINVRKPTFASKKAKEFGLPEIKGLLITGIPGTGKSLDVKAIARTLKVPLLRLDMGSLFGSLVGQSEAQVRQAIEAVEACSPCVCWIDEIEKGMSGMKGSSGDSGTSQRVFGTILTWLQEKTKPVFVVATANRVFDLPPELLRKGRFDEIFFVDLPNKAERAEIAKIHVLRRHRFTTQSEKDKAVAAEAEAIEASKEKPKPEAVLPNMGVIDVNVVADACTGFSGAEIEQAVVDGMFTSYAEERELTTEDVRHATASTMPLSKTMSEDIKKLREWAKGRARMAGSGIPDNAPRTAQTTGKTDEGYGFRGKLDLNTHEPEQPKGE